MESRTTPLAPRSRRSNEPGGPPRRSGPRLPRPAGRLGALARLALALALLGPVPLAGCTPESRYRMLSAVFDGVPPPGTPRKERRRRRTPPPPEPVVPSPEDVTAEALVATVKPAEPPDFETYRDLYAALPKDSMGNLDWVAAAEQGLIRPEPGPDPEAPESPILPYDVRLDPGIPQFEVVFPHAAHTFWLRCDNCHPSIFRMKAGSNPITMAKIFEGQYCGRCHGKVAFPPQTGCPRCHVKLGR